MCVEFVVYSGRFLLVFLRVRQRWFNEAGMSLLNLEPPRPDVLENVVSEDQMDYGMYLFDYVTFSLNGRGGVAGLNVSTLVALCKHYIPEFKVSPTSPPTKMYLLQEFVTT